MLSTKTLFLLSVIPSAVFCHSWLDCSDWRPSTKTCHGWARDWSLRKAEPFATDVGRDIRPGKDVPQGLFCDVNKEPYRNPPSDSYTDEYPMARVGAGQQLTWRWPAKNHATVGVQRGVYVFFSKTADGGDDFSHITTKEAWIQKYPSLTFTFSNCNPNQSGVDNAECTGTFQVPTDLEDGIYTAMFWWEFNAGEYYNSCADIEVFASGDVPPTDPPTRSPTRDPDNEEPLIENCPIEGDVFIENEWNDGFVVQMSFTGVMLTEDWEIEVYFAKGESFANVWNAEVTSETNNVYTLTPSDYMNPLKKGETVTAGFQGSKSNGNDALEGGYVKIKGCKAILFPASDGNGDSDGDQTSPVCNDSGTLNDVDTQNGSCMQTCNCESGAYGQFCESNTFQSYWDIVVSKTAGSSLDFRTCDLQTSFMNLLSTTFDLAHPQVTTELEVRDATADALTIRVYDDGEIVSPPYRRLSPGIEVTAIRGSRNLP